MEHKRFSHEWFKDWHAMLKYEFTLKYGEAEATRLVSNAAEQQRRVMARQPTRHIR